MTKDKPSELNGAELAVLNSRFEGIASKMANTLYRTGRSGVLNRAKDFSCCIVTADCQLLSSPPTSSLPIHVLAGPDMMAQAMLDFHPDVKRGDAFLNNSPYHGCSHAADQTIVLPVIDEKGVHHFTVLAKAHQADIGNSVPTTYHGAARDVYEEGALIFPSVKIQSDYQDIKDIIRMCEMRIRVPEQWYGDYLAALGAARIGEREILDLAADMGWDVLHGFSQQWFDYSEQRMHTALAAMPEGTVTKISTHDPFPGTPEDGIPVKSIVTTNPAEGRIEIDLTDNMDSLPCGLNLSEACALTSAMIGVFNSIDHTTPKNAGSFRRIDIKLREGCVVGIPRHPTSCSVATTNVADRVANGVQQAIAALGDGFGMAEAGSVIPPSASVISGIDPRNGKAYINQIFLGCTGGNASASEDCWLMLAHVGNAGLCYQDSVELDELYQPIHVYERRIVIDTEGAGKFRGAPTFLCEFGPVGADFEIGYVSDGHINAPKGVRGGLDGGNADQFIRRSDGSLERLPSCAQFKVAEGESVVSVGCGGGGYGNPLERDVARVVKDIRDGVISEERARAVYGVVTDSASEADIEATEILRNQLIKKS